MNIKSIRNERGLTTTEVAATLHISQGYYSLLENGKRRFSPEQAKQLSAVLRVPLDMLISLTNLVFENTSIQENWVSRLPIESTPLTTWLTIDGTRLDTQSKSRFRNELVRMVKNNIEKELNRELDSQPQLINALFDIAKRSKPQHFRDNT